MLYKYVGAENGADAVRLLQCFVENHTFKASAPSTFNDPFEFTLAIDFDANPVTVRERYFADNPHACVADYDEWLKTFENSKWSVHQETRAELLGTFGVLCLSAVEDNHLMWSHYASNHRGFCVGIDEQELLKVKEVCGHGYVGYHHKLPVFRYYFDDPIQFFQKSIASKSHLWAYEREYRVITKESGIFELPPSAIQQVVLGCRAYKEVLDYARARCSLTENVWFQMCENFSEYSLSKLPLTENVVRMSSFF
jgi:hypothetical protein